MNSFPTNYFTETFRKFVNNFPIIGIAAMPMDGEKLINENPAAEKKEYFGSSFEKLIEVSGGRAVPVTEVFR